MRFEPYLGHQPDPAASVTETTPAFSGSGGEYFRIWIVNLLLTIATFGIYSAWAKTRRLQYFYRNTQLAGASFDFLGDPKAILRGRIVAVVLVATYQYAFGFSFEAGVATVCVLAAALPFMMRSALRFRLSNTVYRGLPFGFGGSLGGAYLVYLPAIMLLLVPSVLVVWIPTHHWAMLGFLLFFFWPVMHGAMKRYQHRHLMYGDQAAQFGLTKGRLARPYLKMIGLFFVSMIVLVIVVAVAAGLAVGVSIALSGKHAAGANINQTMIGVFVGIASGAAAYLSFLLCGLYVAVRMDNLAWSATSFPGVQITSRMRVRSYLWLQAKNVLLTIATLGLYRPFAVVRTWKYRLAHMELHAPDGFEQATLHAARPAAAAVGDGAADFLGVDLSW